MTPGTVIELGRQGLEMVLLLSAPMLLSALIVGLAVSIFQAATQINEATLSFIPKIVVMFMTLIFAGPWMLELSMDYIRRLFDSIPGLIG